jgi:hypothetical protein
MSAPGRISRVVESIGRVARAAVRLELSIWKSLYRFLAFRPRVPRGAGAFTYDKPIRAILIVFIALSAIEIPIIDLIVHRWDFVRIPLLVLGFWGLTWMVGLLLGYLTRPHAVGPAGLRIRHGDEVEIAVSWSEVASVAPLAERVEGAKTFRSDGDLLVIAVQEQTNIEVELERAMPVRVGSRTTSVRVVRFWVDDPKGYLSAVRTHLRDWESLTERG